MKPLLGFCADSLTPDHLTPERVHAYRSIGIGDIARLGIWLELMWPDPSKPIDFSRTDRQFDVLNDAGVIIYANFFGCPEWMSEGKKTYREGINGCWQFNDQNDPPDHGKLFHTVGSCVPLCSRCQREPDRVQYCFMDPPHINPAPIAEFAGKFALRYRGRFKYAGALNELTAGYGLFWPPSGIGHGADIDGALKRAANEYIRPVIHTIKSIAPEVRSVGPEADGGDGLRRMLEIEPPDIICGHPYIGIFEVEEFMNYHRVFGGGREVWATEQDPIPEWLDMTLTEYPQIAAYTFYAVDELLNDNLTPNEKGKAMRAVIDKHFPPTTPPPPKPRRAKRRVVRS